MAKAVRHPETRDVWPKALLLFGAGLLVFLAIAATALSLIFDTTPFWALAGAETQADEASPALQRFPASDLAAFRRQQDAELGKLGWVDRDAGIARVPIEDAMKLVAERGLPDWVRQAAPADQDCALLEAQVPRAPQVQRCATGAGQNEKGRAGAGSSQPGTTAPNDGALQ